VVADWLSRLEQRLAEGGEAELAVALVALAFAAGDGIDVPDGERGPAGRRALLLLAAGGDPGRGLDIDGRAVTAFAAEIETLDRRRQLQRGLDRLRDQARGRVHVSEALRALADDPETAWRAYAAALLTDELEPD